MDIWTALLAGYAALGTAVAVLWTAYEKSQKARIKEALRHERVLRELQEMSEGRRKS